MLPMRLHVEVGTFVAFAIERNSHRTSLNCSRLTLVDGKKFVGSAVQQLYRHSVCDRLSVLSLHLHLISLALLFSGCLQAE